MRIIVSFDVEVWCNGWSRLDEEFPGAFERYVYGHSRTAGGALPLTLEILRRHGVRGVFFVEPLFAARFGARYLREIVDLIGSAGHQIELHLHSEWADEIRPRPLPHIDAKRQHLQQLCYEDQLMLIRAGLSMLKDAGVPTVNAFRAGSFGANNDTFRAVADAGLSIDSSVNATSSICVAGMGDRIDLLQPSEVGGVLSVPMTVFRDGFGQLRHAQIGSCSFSELEQTIRWADRHGWPAIMTLSHNFEMLRSDSPKIDPIVARRFERFCALVGSGSGWGGSFQANLFEGITPPREKMDIPSVSTPATARRFGEQLARRALPR